MFHYIQDSGKFYHDGELIGLGYSGFQEGKNNPLLQDEPNIGPIPCGLWDIEDAFDSTTHGPHCIPLTPVDGTVTFGRSGFLMHGDSIVHPGLASHGCIIQLHAVREQVRGLVLGGDRSLMVVATEAGRQ